MAEQNTPDKIISGRPWKKGDKFKSFIEGEKTLTFPEGKSREKPTWDEIENCKNITKEEVAKEWENFMKYDASQNKRSFVGNPIIYHYFTKELIKTRYKGGATLEEEWAKDSDKMWANVCKIDRRKAFPPSPVDVFEKNRAITFFKPTIAKHIYTLFGATRVLDPCAGWGGRMLGAMALGIQYTGFDTNLNLHPIYKEMNELMYQSKQIPNMSGFKVPKMLDCSVLKYPNWLASFCGEAPDLILTSPPYFNLEIYPHMSPWKDEKEFYGGFLVPMMYLCYGVLAKGGHMCINISPPMYKKLTEEYDFRLADEKIDFLQQMGQKSGKKVDYIYVWKNDAE